MRMTTKPAFWLTAAAAAAAIAVPLAAQGERKGGGKGQTVLDTLQRGQWTISARDGSPPRSICLGDPAQLVQLRHVGSAGCKRFVVENEPGRMTVQYTCPGNGYGRTSIRRETASLIQLSSQGIAGGRPFQFRGEARRTGACR